MGVGLRLAAEVPTSRIVERYRLCRRTRHPSKRPWLRPGIMLGPGVFIALQGPSGHRLGMEVYSRAAHEGVQPVAVEREGGLVMYRAENRSQRCQ